MNKPKSATTVSNATIVAEHYGEQAPEWVLQLAAECDRTSQKRTADRLGVSPAMVNQALRNAYKGDVDRLAERVRGELLAASVICPVLGEITSRRCLDEQARPRATTNHLRVAVYNACRSGCPHFRGDKS